MNSNCFIIVSLLYFYLSVTLANEGCDKSKCPGPIKFYNDLDCKPVYKTLDSCCPYKFDCDDWKNRPANKCFVNGKEYNVGDHLREEDRGPCDIGCTCDENGDMAQFMCAAVDCFASHHNSSCYHQQKATECCEGETLCLENPEDRPSCIVDGKKYLDGEPFHPQSDPDLDCYCGPGYTGENIRPWCISKKTYCQPQLRQVYEIRNKCAPIFSRSQSPQTSCAFDYRCQKTSDFVIPNSKKDDNKETDDMTCTYGNLTMNFGDELNQGTDYNSKCVRCVCEIGPTLTCYRLPENLCK